MKVQICSHKEVEALLGDFDGDGYVPVTRTNRISIHMRILEAKVGVAD